MKYIYIKIKTSLATTDKSRVKACASWQAGDLQERRIEIYQIHCTLY